MQTLKPPFFLPQISGEHHSVRMPLKDVDAMVFCKSSDMIISKNK